LLSCCSPLLFIFFQDNISIDGLDFYQISTILCLSFANDFCDLDAMAVFPFFGLLNIKSEIAGYFIFFPASFGG
jgi:hypothetical protein